MNMHVAPTPAAASAPFAGRNDRELIALCKRARRLFTRERGAKQRLFTLEDRSQDGRRASAQAEKLSGAVWGQLKAVVADIATLPARKPEGLAYKAAMLAPAETAGFLDDPSGPGRELALSIAFDVRHVGIDAHEDLQRLRRRGAR